MNTVNINGKDFTVEELNKLVEEAKNKNPMLEVYKYHNTTEKLFNEKYKNLPEHIKAHAKECMIVEYYNKGWRPDWRNSNEKKYYPYFNMDNFSYDSWNFYYYCTNSPSHLCFKRKEDLKEAVEKFIDIYRESRLS